MNIEINKNIGTINELSTDLLVEDSLEENMILDFESDAKKNEKNSITAATINEDEIEYTIELSLPGFEPEDISMEIENDILSIEAKTETEKSEKDSRHSSAEFIYSSYSRSFKLPGNLEIDKLVAEYKDEILRLTFPKVEITSLETNQESLIL